MVLANLANGGAGALESLLGWWRLAGVDVLVDDTPRDWLRPEPVRPPSLTPEPAGQARQPVPHPAPQPTQPALAPLPASFSELEERLCDPAFLPTLGSARVAAQGDPSSGVLILTDMPSTTDIESGTLLSGPEGRLFDAMLNAIGLSRESVHLAPVLPGRSPDGDIDPRLHAEAVRFALHRIALARPSALLLLGDATSRALCGTNLSRSRNDNPIVHHDSGQVSAIATFHPRFLIRHPARKADSWRNLLKLVELLRQ